MATRSRSEARRLGSRTRALFALVLTILIFAIQAQLVASAVGPPGDENLAALGGAAGRQIADEATEGGGPPPGGDLAPSSDPSLDDLGAPTGGGDPSDGGGSNPGGGGGNAPTGKSSGSAPGPALLPPGGQEAPEDDRGQVCPRLDGKWDIAKGGGGSWDEGIAAPGITIVTSTDSSVVFDVEAGYRLLAVCVKTGNGVNQGDWTIDPQPPVDGPARVTITSSGGKGSGLSHVSFDTEQIGKPDVKITKTVTFKSPVRPGDRFSYTITVENVGQAAATNVVVTDEIAESLTVVSAEGCDLGEGNTLTCSIGTLAGGASATRTITVEVREGFCGEIKNTATVTADGDDNKKNDSDRAKSVLVECEAGVIVTKEAVIEGDLGRGTSFDYVITVENTGTGPAADVVLRDDLEDSLSVGPISREGCSVGGGNILTCPIGDLAAGGSVTIRVTVTIDHDFCGTLRNKAVVTWADGKKRSVSEEVVLEMECRIAIDVDKTNDADENGAFTDAEVALDPGGPVEFKLVIRNTGDVPLEILSLVDAFGDTTLDLAEACLDDEGEPVVGVDLDPDSSITCFFTLPGYAPPAGETVENTVTVVGGEVGKKDNTADDSDTSEVTTQRVLPGTIGIRVLKTNDADEDGAFHDEEEALKEGDPVTFRVVVRNTGAIPLRITSLTDTFGGTTITLESYLDANGASVIGVVLAPLGEEGDRVVCTFTLDGYAPEPNGRIVNTVTVEGADVENEENRVTSSDTSAVTTPKVLPGVVKRPGPGLAVTGARLTALGQLALTMLLAGAVLSLLGRRRGREGSRP